MIQSSIEFECQPQKFVAMEDKNKNLKQLEEGVLVKDDHQLIIREQGGSFLDGRYHRYPSLDFDKPE